MNEFELALQNCDVEIAQLRGDLESLPYYLERAETKQQADKLIQQKRQLERRIKQIQQHKLKLIIQDQRLKKKMNKTVC